MQNSLKLISGQDSWCSLLLLSYFQSLTLWSKTQKIINREALLFLQFFWKLTLRVFCVHLARSYSLQQGIKSKRKRKIWGVLDIWPCQFLLAMDTFYSQLIPLLGLFWNYVSRAGAWFGLYLCWALWIVCCYAFNSICPNTVFWILFACLHEGLLFRSYSPTTLGHQCHHQLFTFICLIF